jgi:hypothetical protein
MGGSRFWEHIRGCEVSSVHFLVYMLAVVFVIIHVMFEVGMVARITASPIFPCPPHRQYVLKSLAAPMSYFRILLLFTLEEAHTLSPHVNG